MAITAGNRNSRRFPSPPHSSLTFPCYKRVPGAPSPHTAPLHQLHARGLPPGGRISSPKLRTRRRRRRRFRRPERPPDDVRAATVPYVLPMFFTTKPETARDEHPKPPPLQLFAVASWSFPEGSQGHRRLLHVARSVFDHFILAGGLCFFDSVIDRAYLRRVCVHGSWTNCCSSVCTECNA